MKKIAILGAGISGISMARLLEGQAEVMVLEKKPRVGGLIQCDWVEERLFHKVGGHVFNTREQSVKDWFWSFFDQEKDFLKAKRNAKIWMDEQYLGYPIENFLYKLDPKITSSILEDLIHTSGSSDTDPENFEEFLKTNFGNTLYELYFKPYNQKIWNTDLGKVPLEWLEGKLPMPNLQKILLQNIMREEEQNMVHSTFFYPRKGGSQFIIDRLAEGLTIQTSFTVDSIKKNPNGMLSINDSIEVDEIIYTGDARKFHEIFSENSEILESLVGLKSNGTSNMLCETDATDISWLYIPEEKFIPHRIIYTGNFSPNNNSTKGRKTCVVEFSGIVEEDLMLSEIARLPGNLTPIKSNREANSYVIQNHDSRKKIEAAKEYLNPYGIHLLGRFAEWEYYNMDKCMLAAMQLRDKLDL